MRFKRVQNDSFGTADHLPCAWAFLGLSPDGKEGVAAFQTEEGWLPMITTREHVYEMMLQLAHKMVEDQNIPMRVVKFTAREDLQTIWPLDQAKPPSAPDPGSSGAGGDR